MTTAGRTRNRPTHTASGRSIIQYRPNPFTEKQRVSRAIALAAHPQIQAILGTAATTKGRPRCASLPLVARLLFLHALSDPHRMTLASVESTILSITAQSRRRLGLRDSWTSDPGERQRLYRRIWSTFTALVRATRTGVHIDHDHRIRVNVDTGEVDPCPHGCPALDLTPDELVTTIVQASIPRAFRRTRAIAVDGTDFESFAVPYSHGYRTPEGQVCADPDARWGKRTHTDRRPSEHYVGYELHLATYVASVGDREGPRICAGMALRPGVTDRAGAAVALTRAITRSGPVDEALFDRGYTTARPEHFARPLRNLGIAVTMDLHTSQRGARPGPAPGTIWLDGHIYTTALPTPLRHLEPPRVGQSSDVKARTREVFDAREPYRFIPHARHDDRASTQRFKGPGLGGRLRCPNNPATMRLGAHLPTTTCRAGTPCGCGITVTVADSTHERDCQGKVWRSTAWAISYNRRTYTETFNAHIRFTDANLNRGFIQILDRHATALLLAIYLAAHNTIELHRWHTRHDEPDPWATQLNEPADSRPLGRSTRSLRRHRRGPPGEGDQPASH